MAQVVFNYKESRNAHNMINMMLASGLFTLADNQKTKLKKELFHAMDEATEISQKVKRTGSTKELKSFDALLKELR
ncbi:MAG: hypothetical protein J6X43_00610 [Bacteroidales bacterium]|nr:hypothetical protein [Bacteroidales bacterium]